jgi:hypothetical protein
MIYLIIFRIENVFDNLHIDDLVDDQYEVIVTNMYSKTTMHRIFAGI